MKQKIFLYWKPLAAITLWGMSFIATKIVLDELSPREIIFCRLFLGVIFLASAALYTGKKFSVDKKSFWGIFILALVAVFHLWIQVTGMQFTSASNTGWIIGVTPVFMAVLALIFFKEKIKLINSAGIFIAAAGLLLLISGGDLTSIDLLSNKGDFLVLGSAFTWSVYSMINKKISLSFSPVMTILFLFIMMLVLISPFTLSSSFLNKAIGLTLESTLSIIFLGFFCSGAAYVLWAQSLTEMESAKVGAFLYFEPFVTVITAWIILNEDITLFMMFSGIIITLGVVLVNLKENKISFKRKLKPGEEIVGE